MERIEKSYFDADGRYQGTFFLFVPGEGEKLADDGISIITASGKICRQHDPYAAKGFVPVDGPASGAQRLRNGVVEDIPAEDIPAPKPTLEERVVALEALVLPK